MLMLCSHFHTYSICEQSLGLTQITVSHHHSWDGGINVNSNRDSPPGVTPNRKIELLLMTQLGQRKL